MTDGQCTVHNCTSSISFNRKNVFSSDADHLRPEGLPDNRYVYGRKKFQTSACETVRET